MAAGVAVDRTTGFNLPDLTLTEGLILPKTAGRGVKVDPDTPTFPWKDLLGRIAPKTSGAGTPTLDVFRGGQVQRFNFAAGDMVDLDFHIPHDYAPGTDLFVHAHWAHNGTGISGSFVCDFFSLYAKGHDQAAFPAEVQTTLTVSTPNIATIPRYRHRIDEVQLSAASPTANQLDTDDVEPDGLLMMRMVATTIPTITGGTPGRPYVLMVDLHYQSTNVGTKQKAPDFYV